MIAWAESVEHLSKVAERLVRRPTAPTSFTDFTSAGLKRFGSETDSDPDSQNPSEGELLPQTRSFSYVL